MDPNPNAAEGSSYQHLLREKSPRIPKIVVEKSAEDAYFILTIGETDTETHSAIEAINIQFRTALHGKPMPVFNFNPPTPETLGIDIPVQLSAFAFSLYQAALRNKFRNEILKKIQKKFPPNI